MDKNSTTDFKELVRKIESKKILLPDFQREFVWKEEEQQRKIVASVLAKMPIGSILLLKSKPDEYSSKLIGCKNELNTDDIKENVEFLLDGQQRITVLTNVFSNVIHDKCTKISDLISPSLKRRFFLRIPKWSEIDKVEDLFGVKNLEFTIQNPDNEDPEFLSGDILPFVECINFLKDDQKPYNPQMKLSTELDDFCLTYESGYLIPLYLLAPSDDEKKAQIILRYGTIIKNIASKIGEEICDKYTTLQDESDKEKFVVDIFGEKEIYDEIKAGNIDFVSALQPKVELWQYYLEKYLESCIKNVSLNQIIVSESQRKRAIDIYENLNRGGISLNTFDLIMARVAKVSKENFYKRLIAYIQTNEEYKKSVLSDKIEKIVGTMIDSGKYNAAIKTGCYNADKNEINGKYIDAFLDVLSLYCYNKEFDPELFKLENIKRDKILSIEPEDIDKYCEIICTAIDRALFFFQTRCGIRHIQEINYQLMLVLVATVFIKDEFFFDKKVHNNLEAWYWSSLFSGEYDKDQNVVMIQHLQMMIKTFSGTENNTWINNIKDYVLDAQNFSDERFLLYEKVEQDRYPKAIMRGFMCQYLLAKTYSDMFESSKIVSVFSEDAKSLEAHHIIPLGSVTKVGQTTAELRNDKDNICNSPLNFVYITKESNNEISDKKVEDYVSLITDEAKSALYISSYSSGSYDDDYVKGILRNRFTSLRGDIKSHITSLL